MKIVIHRCNSVANLKSINTKYGVELDIRTYNGNLILNHEPYVTGESLDQWIKFYNHKLLILNVKEEGLEDKIKLLLLKHDIENYFFLDQSFPFIIKKSKEGEKKIAVRVSDYESIITAKNVSDLVSWVWLDTFNELLFTEEDYLNLRKLNYKICLASPELHPHNDKSKILPIKMKLKKMKIKLDAVCTKFPEIWE
jgi:hypothetical protein